MVLIAFLAHHHLLFYIRVMHLETFKIFCDVIETGSFFPRGVKELSDPVCRQPADPQTRRALRPATDRAFSGMHPAHPGRRGVIPDRQGDLPKVSAD